MTSVNATTIEVIDLIIKFTINKEDITCTKILVHYSRVLESVCVLRHNTILQVIKQNISYYNLIEHRKKQYQIINQFFILFFIDSTLKI